MPFTYKKQCSEYSRQRCDVIMIRAQMFDQHCRGSAMAKHSDSNQ